MKNDPIRTRILSMQILPNSNHMLLSALKVKPDYCSLGMITTDSDDVSYAALDEATKKSDVMVAYARSMYAGSANANTRLAGEFIGILAGREPDQVISGLKAAADFINHTACFYSADDHNSVVYFAHCISRSGSYLSKTAKVAEGTAIAYVIAPPVEAMMGLDAALKVAEVKLKVFYGPPTNTNFAGGLLAGDQAACKAACEAFAETVRRIAEDPIRSF